MNDVNIAFIPARAGSTGIKDKNLKKIGGLTLINRTYSHALKSGIFKNIILSTDSLKILSCIYNKMNLKYFNSIPEDELLKLSNRLYFHKRPKNQAETLSPISDVIFSLSNRLNFDQMWMLQPTSPFRNKSEFKSIEELLKRLKKNNIKWSSIVSCKEVIGSHPERMYRSKGNYLKPLLKSNGGDNIPRQLLEKLLIKDGGFYILKRNNIYEKNFLGEKIVPFIRGGFNTINIDSMEDLLLARIVSGKNG